MQINKNTNIAGEPASTIRKILRGVAPSVSVSEAAFLVGWKNLDRTKALMNEMVALGYFTNAGDGYSISEQGRAIRDAKWVDYLTRAMAENLLQRVVETAETINHLPDVTHCVREMYVVGSFLEGGDNVKKLEIVVRLEARIGDAHDRTAIHGVDDILRTLRRFGKHVDVRPATDPVIEGVARKLVFRSEPDAQGKPSQV